MERGLAKRLLSVAFIITLLEVGAVYVLKGCSTQKSYPTQTTQTTETENNSSNLLYRLYTN